MVFPPLNFLGSLFDLRRLFLGEVAFFRMESSAIDLAQMPQKAF